MSEQTSPLLRREKRVQCLDESCVIPGGVLELIGRLFEAEARVINRECVPRGTLFVKMDQLRPHHGRLTRSIDFLMTSSMRNALAKQLHPRTQRQRGVLPPHLSMVLAAAPGNPIGEILEPAPFYLVGFAGVPATVQTTAHRATQTFAPVESPNQKR